MLNKPPPPPQTGCHPEFIGGFSSHSHLSLGTQGGGRWAINTFSAGFWEGGGSSRLGIWGCFPEVGMHLERAVEFPGAIQDLLALPPTPTPLA